MEIIKAGGEKEEFKEEKLRDSLKRSGADKALVDYVVEHIKKELRDGITTKEIYAHAFEVLKREAEKPIAARYSLKKAVMTLGPTGFPFESLLARIFEEKGYSTRTGITIRGKCAEHEVDVIAEKDDELMGVEAKYHNNAGFKTDLKTALYIKSRSEDLKANSFDGLAEGKKHDFWLITNTSLTSSAIEYGNCSGLVLIDWTYPENRGLVDMIESTAIHPITALTTLSNVHMKKLLEKGHVLCGDLKGKMQALDELNISPEERKEVEEEIEHLCVPR